MATHIELLDTVAVTEDLPDLGLTTGEVGAVVEILGDGETFEVEFCDNSGQTYGLYTLRADQIIALHTRGQAFRLYVEAAWPARPPHPACHQESRSDQTHRDARDGFLVGPEMHPHPQRGPARADRGGLPGRAVRTADDLHAGGTARGRRR